MLKNRLRNHLLTGVLAAAMTVTLTPANEIMAWADVSPGDGAAEIVSEEGEAPEENPDEEVPAAVDESAPDAAVGQESGGEADPVLSVQDGESTLTEELIKNEFFKGWNVSVSGVGTDNLLVTLNSDVHEGTGVSSANIGENTGRITVDLNGHSVYMEKNEAFEIQKGNHVTIVSTGGASTLDQKSSYEYVIRHYGRDEDAGSLTLGPNLSIHSAGGGIRTFDAPVTLNNVTVETSRDVALYSDGGDIVINNDSDHPVAFRNYTNPEEPLDDVYASCLIQTSEKVTLSDGTDIDAGRNIGLDRDAILCDSFECGEGAVIRGGSVVYSEELGYTPSEAGHALMCDEARIGDKSSLYGGDGTKVPHSLGISSGKAIYCKESLIIGEGCTITGGHAGDSGDSYTTKGDTDKEYTGGDSYTVIEADFAVVTIGDNTTITQFDAGNGYDKGGNCKTAVTAGKIDIGKNVTIKAGNGGNSSPEGTASSYYGMGGNALYIAEGDVASTIASGTVITGGNGGNGKYGSYGGRGIVTCSSGIEVNGATITGGNGGKGSSGAGGPGERGVYIDPGYGVVCQAVLRGCSITGGNGGSSEYGKGGDGRPAIDFDHYNGKLEIYDCPKICSGNGGNGGKDGGTVLSAISGPEIYIADSHVYGGATGKSTSTGDAGEACPVVEGRKSIEITGSLITGNTEDTWASLNGPLVELHTRDGVTGYVTIRYSKIIDLVDNETTFKKSVVETDKDSTLTVENSEITGLGRGAVSACGKIMIDENSKIAGSPTAFTFYNYDNTGGYIRTTDITDTSKDESSVGVFSLDRKDHTLNIKRNGLIRDYKFEVPAENGDGWMSLAPGYIISTTSDRIEISMYDNPVVRVTGLYHENEYELATYRADEDPTVNISFYMGLEGVTQIEPQKIKAGTKATKPAEPMADGYVFMDWYTDPTHETLFDFGLPVNENTTVYGYWEAGETTDPEPVIDTVTVEFDMGLEGVAQIEKQEIEKGSTATEPEKPTAKGYDFKGWYSDSEHKTLFDFTKPVDENTVLYAYWVVHKEDDPNPGPNGGGGGRGSGGGSASTPAGTVIPETPVPTTENPVPTTETPGTDVSFTDVPATAWFADAVRFVVNNGCMKGLSATEFGPDVEMNRGMVVTILYRLAGSPVITTASSFNDVKAGMYYADAVAWASSNGIVKGFEDNTFRPDQKISREDLVTMLYRYETFTGADVSVAEGVDLSAFGDAAQIGDYAVDSIKWACSKGLITGFEDGTIRPEGFATRAQVAVMLQRLMK